jgi:hypothetical protein
MALKAHRGQERDFLSPRRASCVFKAMKRKTQTLEEPIPSRPTRRRPKERPRGFGFASQKWGRA